MITDDLCAYQQHQDSPFFNVSGVFDDIRCVMFFQGAPMVFHVNLLTSLEGALVVGVDRQPKIALVAAHFFAS